MIIWISETTRQCPSQICVPHMKDPAETTQSEGNTPIFTEDIPCPACGYNLRGLSEARCPECGHKFSPILVLREYQQRRRVLPGSWVIKNVHLHPVGFWQDVQDSWGPDGWQPPLLVAIGMGLAWGISILDLIFAWVIRRMPLDVLLVGILQVGLVLGLGLGAVLLLLLGHRVLVNLVLLSTSDMPWVDAWIVVGYPAAWLVSVLPATACGFFAVVETLMRGSMVAPGTWAVGPVLCLICGLGLLVLLALWSAALYSGGQRISGGSLVRGVLCSLTNPFLWLLGAIQKGRPNIVRGQLRIVVDHLLRRKALRHGIQDDRDIDAGPANARLAAGHVRIDADSSQELGFCLHWSHVSPPVLLTRGPTCRLVYYPSPRRCVHIQGG